MSRMETVQVCGLRFLSSASPDDVAELLASRLPRGAAVFTPNAEIMHRALRDRIFYNKLAAADLLLPDGQGIGIAAAFRGRRLLRMPGVDVGTALVKTGRRVYLFGGREGVAARAAERLSDGIAAANIVGFHAGYYPAEEEMRVASEIARKRPEILFVCLGSPRQEEWILKNRLRFPETLMLGLGGSIDVYAGDAKRAPLPLRQMGLEWAYRAARDPSRIPRLAALPLFLTEAYLAAEVERFRRGIPRFSSNCTKNRKKTLINEKNVRI